MSTWNTDRELFALAKRELFPALVGDILDKLGFLHQFLPQSLKPIDPAMIVIGRAMPVLEADVVDETDETTWNPLMKKPFGLMFEALDSLAENEVYVCSGASPRYALWGGLMSARAIALKAAGAVTNGFHRDTNDILRLQFPTFSLGSYAQDQGPRGLVLDYRTPIEWDGIRIAPGDIIYGDRDGVLVIPREAEHDAFMGAFEKVRGEKDVLRALESGMSTVEAFEVFGIM